MKAKNRLPTTSFLGLDFAVATYDKVGLELDRLSRSGQLVTIITPNVDDVVTMYSDSQDEVSQQFCDAMKGACVLTCDSRVLQTLAMLRGVKLEVVTGSDLTAYLFEQGKLDGRNVALIGGDEAMLDDLRRRFPSIRLSQHIPPMGVLENENAIVAIEKFVASDRFDYIFFALGGPGSKIIAHRCAGLPGATGVALCIGASIEFLLGRKARAPRLMQYARMEWLFRLLSEPRRLWRRYLITGPRILVIVGNWKKP